MRLTKQDLWKVPDEPVLEMNEAGASVCYQLDNTNHCFSKYEKRGREAQEDVAFEEADRRWRRRSLHFFDYWWY